jgi:multiple sugar transport system substrate-binding protein
MISRETGGTGESGVRGMTWDHSRGVDPLAAAASVWEARTGTAIAWDRRSLQDFESWPVEELARRYDLIVIDHPHVGQVAESGCLLALDEVVDAAVLAEIAGGSVGGSYESYHWAGHQWALPVDAAAQVQAWVPGRIAAPVTDWATLALLVADGRASLPLRPPHSLMSLFTLCGLVGISLDGSGDALFPDEAARACDLLAALARNVDPAAFEMDPIALFEEMARPEARLAVAPLIYGYANYAVTGFRPELIRFADIPALGHGPRGSALGGTGIAVSAYGDDPAGAAAFAAWVSSGAVQRDLVAAHGGQPGHADAWDADSVNAATHDFYRATRATLDQAWLRPRHAGYMAFQHAASERLNEGLRGVEDGAAVIAALNRLYKASKC